MKKFVLILIIAALVYLSYNAIKNGTNVFAHDIPSYAKLKQDNLTLDSEIAALNGKIYGTYATEVGKVATSKSAFNMEKQQYDTLAAEATDEQLEAAMREEEFLLDYLWIVVGNYAEDNNVKFEMRTNPDFSIDFDVTGSYISIINFVYDLANDPELRFIIDNMQLEGGSNKDAVTKAKFTVYGINVVTK